MAIDPTGAAVRVEPVRRHGLSRRCRTARPEPFATDLGVACGLAFAPDGTLFVGDRSGTIFRVDRDGQATTFATLPAERGGVSPRDRPRRRAVCQRSDAVVLRSAVPHRRRRRGVDALRRRSGGRRGWRSIPNGIALRRRRAGRRRAARTGAARTATRSSCSPVPRWSASRSTATATLVVASNETAYDCAVTGTVSVNCCDPIAPARYQSPAHMSATVPAQTDRRARRQTPTAPTA